MRLALLVLAALASAPASAFPRLVAQIAAPAAGSFASAARPDAEALQRAAPRFAALGLRVHRAFLDGLPARERPLASAAASPWTAAFAPERVVLLDAPDSAAAEQARRALADDPAIDWVEPLRTRTLQLASFAPPGASPGAVALLDSLPDDPLLRNTKQWGLDNVGPAGYYGGVVRADSHAPEAWHVSVGSNDLKLAYADTGIDPAQPELGGLMPDGSPRIVDAINVTDEAVPAVTDSFGHGTPVAGVMAARTNDGAHFSGLGVAGVCGGDGAGNAGCRIVPIKIAPGHSGEATSFDVARAILWATDAGARAMNLSFAGEGGSRIERLALGYAVTRGCIVVAAAGNEGARDPRRPEYPAAYAAEGLCIQVGASTSFDERALFSSFGPGLDLVAPGVDDWTTFMTYPSYYGATYDGYVAASGTSFAAPFVTGAVGLLAAARPELIDTDYQHLLRESADDIDSAGVDPYTGWGRLNMARALDAVRPEIGIWHDEVHADSIVAEQPGTLQIGESGPGTLDRFRGAVVATRFAAFATVTLPDSFADSARVWTRVGGTFAARGDFRLPYFTPTAQVVARDGRTFTLRGWLYRVDEDCSGCPDPWIPLPPEYVRFGFTVLGPVTRGAVHPSDAGGGARAALRAGPSPFRGALELHAPGAGRIAVIDAGGRVVRSLDVGAGAARWDGRDASGRPAPAGLYFVRWSGAAGTRVVRVVRLGG